MKMRIKAIATDLDGTLVDEKYEIASVAVEAVRRAERLGTPVITATARPVEHVEDFIRRYDLNTSGPIIAENGGVVKDRRTDKEIILGSVEKAKKAYEAVKSRVRGLEPFPLPDSPYYVQRRTDVQLKGDTEALKGLLQIMANGKLDADVTYAPLIGQPGQFLIFIKDPRADKGSGLKAAAKMLGISIREVAAIGDSANDFRMFEVSGFGIAVENADDELKEKADLVVKGVYGEGAAKAFDYILRNLI